MWFYLFLMMTVLMPIKAQAQLLTQVCDLVARSSGVLIQQVDQDWNLVTFDCENIEVLVVTADFENHIMPGQFHNCESIKQGIKMYSQMPVGVSGERAGVYHVTVTRFNEVNQFSHVVIESINSGCDVTSKILEVNFDMTQQVKKD